MNYIRAQLQYLITITVKIISVYVQILLNHISMFYMFKMKTKRVVLYFKENKKAMVLFIFLWLLMFFMKQKRGNAV